MQAHSSILSRWAPTQERIVDVKVRILDPQTGALWMALVVRSGDVAAVKARVEAEHPTKQIEAFAL